MVRRVDAFFPQRERPEGNIIDRGYSGQARLIHIHEGDITAVNNYVRDHVPSDSYVSVVAYGRVFITSPPGGKLVGSFPEHRTVLRYKTYHQFFTKYYQDQLREKALAYKNPATELHEIEYFAIRYKRGRFGG